MYEILDTAVLALGRAWTVTMIAMAVLAAATILSHLDGAIYGQGLEAAFAQSV